MLRNTPIGIDKTTCVRITIPGRPYLFLRIINRLLRLVNIFFGLVFFLKTAGRIILDNLITPLEAKVNNAIPSMPPMLVYKIVSKNDILKI